MLWLVIVMSESCWCGQYFVLRHTKDTFDCVCGVLLGNEHLVNDQVQKFYLKT